jgi:hypothetical protein
VPTLIGVNQAGHKGLTADPSSDETAAMRNLDASLAGLADEWS